jgi:hypothetical protein
LVYPAGITAARADPPTSVTSRAAVLIMVIILVMGSPSVLKSKLKLIIIIFIEKARFSDEKTQFYSPQ